MKKYLVILTCFLLVLVNAAHAGVVFVDQNDNTGYIFTEENPSVKYYIKNLADFTVFTAYAALHRNDYDELTLIGDSVHLVGRHTHKYEVLAGGGKVHIYFYRLLDNDFGDELYLEMSEKQIKGIVGILEDNKISKVTKDNKPSIQAVSTYSQIANNARASDAYGTMAGLSRVTTRDSVKEIMLMYHPALSVRDTLDSGVNTHNVTELYSDMLYILNKFNN